MHRYPNLEAERARRDIRKGEFAEMLGVTMNTYRNWQRGRTPVTREAAAKMVEIFGMSEEYLLKDAKAEKTQEV